MKIQFTNAAYSTIILANGTFPRQQLPLSFLRQASRIICCDGAADNLLKYGLKPDYIVGDLDSLSEELKQHFKYCLHCDTCRETNDLTKAVKFCVENRWNELTIVGATGKREDHSIGNISLIADYAEYAKVQLITDYGVFNPLLKSGHFESFAGQQVSIFSITPNTIFTFRGLKYPLTKQTLSQWWTGTLNEALGNDFFVEMDYGKALVFRQALSSSR